MRMESILFCTSVQRMDRVRLVERSTFTRLSQAQCTWRLKSQVPWIVQGLLEIKLGNPSIPRPANWRDSRSIAKKAWSTAFIKMNVRGLVTKNGCIRTDHMCENQAVCRRSRGSEEDLGIGIEKFPDLFAYAKGPVILPVRGNGSLISPYQPGKGLRAKAGPIVTGKRSWVFHDFLRAG